MRRPSHNSTVRRRDLGEELRKHRQRAGFSGNELALKLGWHASSITRLEKGERTTSEVLITQYLAYCGGSNEEIQRMLDLHREASDDSGFCFQPHGERLPDGLHTLVRHETTASTIQWFEVALIPGLLQTEDKESVSRYRVILADLAKVALDEGQSAGRLAQLANEYDRPGAQYDDTPIPWPDLA
jgi:transcriptional regulator with XRE-family HTH domain